MTESQAPHDNTPDRRPTPPTDSGISSSIRLSLVVPVYNERKRFPPYLEAIRRYMPEAFGPAWELIVVDDGSRDGLAEELLETARRLPQLRVIRHPHNRGKGAAIRTGMEAALGEILLFADADGATPIEEEKRLREYLKEGVNMVVGSRLLADPGVVRQRKPLRGLLGRLFAIVARTLLRLPVRDTQCGFKMFRAEPGKRLFALSREEGYLLDLELLILAERCGYRVAEAPVCWTESPQGRFHVLRDLGGVLRGLVRLYRRRTLPLPDDPTSEPMIPKEKVSEP